MRNKNKTIEIEKTRHSLAHIMAMAVLFKHPDAKLGIGPIIENGFYYDFEFSSPISEKEFPAIEKQMKKIIKQNINFKKTFVSYDEAKKIFRKNPYKTELLKDINKSKEKISIYESGNFIDLCSGPHIKESKSINIEAFAITHLAGAYWKGDEKNKQLTRIYAVAFETKKELEEYLTMREEAEKRDHRKIGKELEIFFFDDLVGKGLPMWLPNGTIIKNEIEKLAIETEDKYGYVRVSTPHLAKEELYIKSGHLPYYKDSMYPSMKMDDGTYYLKAMNCPHHHLIYNSKPRSYRDLPLRIAEYGTVYRNELSGALSGLLRVRSLQMNDAHIYCSKDQISQEFKDVLKLTLEYFKLFGLKDYWFRLSKWDSKHKEKYLDEPESWKYTESILRKALKESGVKFLEVDDEAAFYGPKVDVQFKSVMGREETMSTIQLDFIAKTRFGLKYIDKKGKENNQVFVIHRAPLSTHERFIAFLIEYYAGVFPVWLAPIQVVILTVSEKNLSYAEKVEKSLLKVGVRAKVMRDNQTLGKKIREAEIKKIPYALIIGDKERKNGDVSVRSYKKGNVGAIKTEKFIEKISNEIKKRK